MYLQALRGNRAIIGGNVIIIHLYYNISTTTRIRMMSSNNTGDGPLSTQQPTVVGKDSIVKKQAYHRPWYQRLLGLEVCLWSFNSS